VAHDFNNLLSVINGYGEMLLGTFAEADPRRARIEEIVAAGRRATGLTGQLLAFSRRQIAEPRVVDLNALIGETEKMLHRLIGEDIVLEFVRGPGLGHVRIDPVHLDQVLINLAVNARDAMPGGGTLRIETANARVDADFARLHPPTEPGRHVVLSMTDTGMDTETQQHAFEPFYTTKGTGKGTGLGLATVYGIVKQSGGYVWIESAPGKGTCFRIYLPLVESACDPVPAAAPDSIVGGSETILVVEDNAPLRDLVRGLAQELGYSVLSAANGQEAIEVAARHPGRIDLMLTDVIMPGMNARELARALCARHSDLKVLYMSGYSRDVLGSRNALDPDVRLIAKPIGRARLAGALRQVLDGHPDRAAKAA
jgi:CheY-like chemotaxis protein